MGRALVITVMITVAGCSSAQRAGVNGSGGTDGGGGSGGGGGFGGGGGGGSGATFASMCENGAMTTIVGTIVAPNGNDPVASAIAYVPISHDPIPAGVDCELCGTPYDGAEATATSDAAGRFTLDISKLTPSRTVTLTVNKGRFRRTSSVPITPCTANRVDPSATQLPSKSGAMDDIPKIAVATGNKDELDVVLVAMGLDATVGFDCYEGRVSVPVPEKLTTPCIMQKSAKGQLPDIATLLADETKLEQYNLLFISCAPGKYASIALKNPQQATTIATNLRTWTGKGGRLFATDNSYDYVAQAFPSQVAFVNGETSLDAANVGVGGTAAAPASYSGKINDATLATWLATVGAIPSGTSTLKLDGYIDTWSTISSVPANTVDVVDAIDAQVYIAPLTRGPAMSYPQTVRFDVAPAGKTSSCGRVIYTSYHTLAPLAAVGKLAPQESILEFMMFEATSCLGAI
jgi:hypothetical protein